MVGNSTRGAVGSGMIMGSIELLADKCVRGWREEDLEGGPISEEILLQAIAKEIKAIKEILTDIQLSQKKLLGKMDAAGKVGMLIDGKPFCELEKI